MNLNKKLKIKRLIHDDNNPRYSKLAVMLESVRLFDNFSKFRRFGAIRNVIDEYPITILF